MQALSCAKCVKFVKSLVATPVVAALVLVTSGVTAAAAQQRLPTLPGYQQYAAVAPQLRGAVVSGAIRGEWDEDGARFVWTQEGQRRAWVASSGAVVELAPVTEVSTGAARRVPGPARGRQFTEAESPDGSMTAVYEDRNVVIRRANGPDLVVTTTGNEAARTKFGTGSWVYGEELGQRTAMWWSPDGGTLAYYGFDESPVVDYLLQMDQTKIQSTIDVEAYPKAGAGNPVVEVYAYDVASGTSRPLDVRSGAPFEAATVGYYVYGISWTPAGDELLIHRTNRLQNVMELAACSPASGACRTVIREEWPTGWVDNSPEMVWLADGRRFIWASERTGFQNYYLYDIDGSLLTTLTAHPFEVAGIERVDEDAGLLWYRARSGDNHMLVQLHRVGLDGTGDVRLTDPTLNHTVQVAPDGRHIVDVAQTHDRAPTTRVLDADGAVVGELAESDLARWNELGLQPVELFEFTAGDGETTLHGMLHKPSNFDPTQRYPLLVSVYAGPATNGARESFTTPHPYTELGFLVATLDSRSAAGRGKRFLDAIYRRLGTVEIDDQAAGVRALATRPYIDGSRVGIFGTSYGGYASVLALLRYPEVFAAASGSSSVTDWRHYDTIYTERYMATPQENPEGYDAGSAVVLADALEGELLLYYGTADNNVHPSNALQLIEALQAAGKSFEVQVGPDRGHTAVNGERMMEFFIDRLVLGGPAARAGH